MKIVYAGTPEVAVEPLRHLMGVDGLEIVAVLTREDAPVGRRRTLSPSPVARAAEELGLPVLKANRVDEDVVQRLRATGARAGAIVAYGALLKRPALEALPLGWVNLHFSLLPRWRGAAPVQHALIAGDDRLGASAFVLDEGLDTGALLATMPVEVRDDDVAGTLLARMAVEAAPLLAGSLLRLEAGQTPQPQVGEATSAPKLTTRHSRIDWSVPAEVIARLVRGTTPEPGPWTELDGQRFKIVDRVLEDPATTGLAPGAVELDGGRVLVGTGTHALELLRVQPAGKQPMAAADWARGRLGRSGRHGSPEQTRDDETTRTVFA